MFQSKDDYALVFDILHEARRMAVLLDEAEKKKGMHWKMTDAYHLGVCGPGTYWG